MAAGSDNTIIGMSGDDHLNGGPGSLPGGAGADRFDHGSGNDVPDGGSGNTVGAAIARTSDRKTA